MGTRRTYFVRAVHILKAEPVPVPYNQLLTVSNTVYLKHIPTDTFNTIFKELFR